MLYYIRITTERIGLRPDDISMRHFVFSFNILTNSHFNFCDEVFFQLWSKLTSNFEFSKTLYNVVHLSFMDWIRWT